MNAKNYAPKATGILFITLIILHILSTMIYDFGIIPENIADMLTNLSLNPTNAYISFFIVLASHWGALILAVLLYIIVKPFNKTLALLAFTFRLAEAIIGVFSDVNLLDLFDISQTFVHTQAFNKSFYINVTKSLLSSYSNATIGGLGAITFSISSLLFNYIFYKSQYVPKFISIYGMIASILVFFGVVLGITTKGHGTIILVIWIMMMVSELIYGFWLPIKGIRYENN